MPKHESIPDDDHPALEADLREAIQHRRAAQEKAEQTRAELAVLLERAQWIIARKEGQAPDPPPSAANDPEASERGPSESIDAE